MNILAVDTSTTNLSLALKTDTSFEERFITSPSFSPSENLLGEIKDLLKRENLTLKDLDLLICTKGPGSFTGLRITMSLLKGIALAGDIPLVSVPTLDAIEDSVSSVWQGPVASVIDAKKKKYYFRFSVLGNVIIKDKDEETEKIVDELDGRNCMILLTGPDARSFYEKALKSSPSSGLILAEYAPRALGRSLIKLGQLKYEKYGPDDIGEGPVYIRRSDAEEMLLKKTKESENEN